MKHTVPRSPFTTRLSGSAKETELRIRNIFQWKKKRPPVALFILTAALVLSCCGLVSCQAEKPPAGNTTVEDNTTAENIELLRTVEVLSTEYDFTHDGVPETVILEGNNENLSTFWGVCVTQGDGVLWRDTAATSHAGWNSLFACTLDDKDYLLRYHPTMYQGACSYSYQLFSLSTDGEKVIVQENSVAFDTNFGSPIFTGFDASSVADFMEEINNLLSHSNLMFSTDEELDSIIPENPQHTPGWLTSDSSHWGYFYIENRTMRENILAFGEIINTSPRPKYYELHSLTLDEDGTNDDSVILSLYQDGEGNRTGQMDIRVLLGNGETLTWVSSEETHYSSPNLQGAYLTSTDRQSVVIQLPIPASTYGAADNYILEVTDGSLNVFSFDSLWAVEYETVIGLEIASRPDSDLSCARITTFAGKWHSPEWGTLYWDNAQWNFTEDGYFTDTHSLTVDSGMELTLALRGRYAGDYYWYYDQIQILHGETVLQTITKDTFAPDGHCPFEFFNADSAYHRVLTYDINFDGYTDFGIPCNTTHNDGHVWFLYDPQTHQYRFAFSLAGEPIADKETQRIIEEWWDDSVYITYNTYEYNAQGQLTLVDSRTNN